MAAAPLPKRKPGELESEMEKQRLEIVDHAYQLCREYLPGPWAKIGLHEFEITPLGGGLTNKLYICSLPAQYHSNGIDSTYPKTVLLRLYGLILQDFKAQIQESVVFSILAERGVGPRLFAVFPNGRLEEFIPCRTLSTSDLNIPVVSRQIAVRMAEYHQLDMPVKKEPTFIMNKLLDYFENFKDVQFSDPNKQLLLRKFASYSISEEVQAMKQMLAEMDPVVLFCHNDVQEGNLLHSDDNTRDNPIQMIDFEYSSYNYRGFDIGNHFCEWMYDYTHSSWPYYSYKIENFPTKEQQINFVESYLDSMYTSVPARRNDPRWSTEFVLHEANRLSLMSNLFWGLWSVRQAQISDIEFGYMEYALARMDAYFRLKKLLDMTN